MDDETPPSPTTYWVRRRRESMAPVPAPGEADVLATETDLMGNGGS